MRASIICASVLVSACGDGGAVPAFDGGVPTLQLGAPVSIDKPWTDVFVLNVVSQNGDVMIVGDSSDGQAHLTTTPFVIAAPGDPALPEALADVTSGVAIGVSPHTITTGCSYASLAHGDIPRTATGCSNLVLHVPRGTIDSPLTLSAHTVNGALTVQNLDLADIICQKNLCTNLPFNIIADVGDVSVTGATGSVLAESNHGRVDVTDAPNPPKDTDLGTERSYIAVQSSRGDATLTLPSDFAADRIDISAVGGTVTVVGFADVTANSLSRGDAGTGAAGIYVNAAQGNVTIAAF